MPTYLCELENQAKKRSSDVWGETPYIDVGVLELDLEFHPGPVDTSVLHLQSEHRSTEVWRVGGGDSIRCRRRNPNQD
ncbi:hypothetical protein AgCh_039127 [Apium graveolens]